MTVNNTVQGTQAEHESVTELQQSALLWDRQPRTGLPQSIYLCIVSPSGLLALCSRDEFPAATPTVEFELAATQAVIENHPSIRFQFTLLSHSGLLGSSIASPSFLQTKIG